MPEVQSTADLSDLVRRVKEATGADDVLDRDIALALGWARELDREVYASHHEPPWYWTDPDGFSCGHRDGEIGPERFTASIDAVLALAKRILPTANYFGSSATSHGVDGYVSRNNVHPVHRWVFADRAATPALAILAALLTALTTEGDHHG